MDPKTIIISLLCEEEQNAVVKQRRRKRKWYFRMSYEKFQELLTIIKPDLTRQNPTFRSSIPPAERLAVTLRTVTTIQFFNLYYNFDSLSLCNSGESTKDVDVDEYVDCMCCRRDGCMF
ncbi:hypothetical protein NQ317_000054 [Molorchus minor]|uniref:BHLH domain-containing protein n=1 Tax=Molorchus minor TaxID=1323400 RepID=A0ABQ9JJK9_9CUCU|nr:hypothetical protein NQ317_000054 [Molorchus minor]